MYNCEVLYAYTPTHAGKCFYSAAFMITFTLLDYIYLILNYIECQILLLKLPFCVLFTTPPISKLPLTLSLRGGQSNQGVQRAPRLMAFLVSASAVRLPRAPSTRHAPLQRKQHNFFLSFFWEGGERSFTCAACCRLSCRRERSKKKETVIIYASGSLNPLYCD